MMKSSYKEDVPDKRRILQVTTSLDVGGAEKMAYNMYKYADREEYHFDYVSFDKSGLYSKELELEGVKVFYTGRPSKLGYVSFFRKLLRIMKDNGPYDVVHSHNFTNNGLVLAAAFFCSVPIRISHSHTTLQPEKSIIRIIYTIITKIMIKLFATHYVACGLEAGKSLYGDRSFKRRGIILNNGIDLQDFKFFRINRNRLRKELSVQSKKVIIQVARLSEEKNHTFSIQILKALLRTDPDAVLVFVGDGPLMTKLKQQASENGLTHKILFLGSRSDVSKLLSAADVYIMPSFYEGIPLALIEAQASKLPVVVSDRIDKGALITHKSKVLSLDDSELVWAKVLSELINDTNGDRDSKIENAMEKYDADRMVYEFEKRYY